MEVFRFKCETYSSISYDSNLNLKEPLESVYVKFRESNYANSVETNQDLYSYSDIEKNDFSMKVESSIKSTLSSSSLISSTLSSTTITTSMQTSSTTLDFSCSNSVCICKDTLSFYSTIQQKCINYYVSYCASLNSTLLIADDSEKFDFFRNVSKNIPKVGTNTRTFVNAKITTANVYQWMNNKPINVSYFATSIVLTVNHCFAYSSTANFLLLMASCSSGTANGICEYSE
ncbi:unnamed protein product [Brachionus calyciflorus]|uniref:C-type lectin n=1 Tax=Brachionus calyciflorus TaxID=104777 RepID=A0A813NZ29_9BILA|nr:unnamed protein product [Brachionus calyciflorus]